MTRLQLAATVGLVALTIAAAFAFVRWSLRDVEPEHRRDAETDGGTAVSGLSGTPIQTLYNRTVRPHLPRKITICAGVAARRNRILDASDRIPNYKAGVIDAIHETVEGREVVLVGGGRAVTTVHCCRAGAASVTAFEPAAEMCETFRETLGIEDPDVPVDLRQAGVGPAVDVFGDDSAADWLDPSDLPNGDVLILDCEGAETAIIEGMEPMYDIVIAESHPAKGSPDRAIESSLSRKGYSTDIRPYKPGDGEKSVILGRCQGGTR